LDIITSVISVLIGGGILAFLQFLITRHDSKHDRLKELLDAIKGVKKDVDAVRSEADRREAILSRTHILRFRDELYNDVKHTSEYFEQTLDDIEVYERFCNDHPDFANGRTKAAAKYIREEYERLFKAHKLE
jgi:uncharacterized protein YoxC